MYQERRFPYLLCSNIPCKKCFAFPGRRFVCGQLKRALFGPPTSPALKLRLFLNLFVSLFAVFQFSILYRRPWYRLQPMYAKQSTSVFSNHGRWAPNLIITSTMSLKRAGAMSLNTIFSMDNEYHGFTDGFNFVMMNWQCFHVSVTL